MNKVQKSILVTIIILVIIIIFTLLAIILNINKGKNSNIYNSNKNSITIDNQDFNNIVNNEDIDESMPMEDPNASQNQNPEMKKLKYMNNRSEYFTIKTLVNNFISYAGYDNKIVLNDIVHKDYITGIIDIPKVKEGYHFENIIVEMLTAQINEKQYIYIVKGNGRVVETNNTFKFNLMVRTDEGKSVYVIYPLQYLNNMKYDAVRVGDTINCGYEEIKENENNRFSYIVRNDLDMAREYFNNYNELLVYYEENAYSKLNGEYAQKRFENMGNFKQYLKESRDAIKHIEISSYKAIKKDAYTDYICTDQYNNYYIFRQQGGIMRYTVFLDDYTIPLTEAVEEYKEAESRDKARYQLDTFIKKINTKDYKAIYNDLDDNFRNNNFKTIDALKNYIKQNFYDLNKINVEEYDEQNGYSVFVCEVSNLKNNNETKKMTVIIKLEEEMNFKMSFSFNN